MSTLSTKQVSISNSAGTQVANLTCGTSGELLVDGVDVSSFQRSLSQNGYQILPSGLIIQWGLEPIGVTNKVVTFPIAFTTSFFSALATSYRASSTSGGYDYIETTPPPSLTSMELIGTSDAAMFWIAIGY